MLLVACCVCGPRLLRKVGLLEPLIKKKATSDQNMDVPEGYAAAAP